MTFLGRTDSRSLLKLLIGINIVLGIYMLVHPYPSSTPSTSEQLISISEANRLCQLQIESKSDSVKNLISGDSNSISISNPLLSFPSDQSINNNNGGNNNAAGLIVNSAALVAPDSLAFNPIVNTNELAAPGSSNNNNNNINSNSNSNNVNSNSNNGAIDDDSRSMPQSPWWTIETRGAYTVINNYVIQDGDQLIDSVTLTTQGSYEFLHHSVALCKRWDGPVSIAVYAPGDDIKVALEIIYYLRRCRDACVRSRISWHIIYDTNHGPYAHNLSFPDSLVSSFKQVSCNLNNEQLLTIFNSTYRSDHKLPYPINVLRNVARFQARTKYLLASDIELYPSVNVIPMFKQLLQRESTGLVPLINSSLPHVYVLPIFEVKSGLEPPATKNQLLDMVHKGDAIFFHKYVCDICQNFPDRNEWLKQYTNDTLNIWRVTKRTRKRSSWEPLYIGTNSEPWYDERLTWDGKRDKMSQMYEMCLMNYQILVLDNAFLVHAPGIKYISKSDQSKRINFIRRNNQIYNSIMALLRRKYLAGGRTTDC